MLFKNPKVPEGINVSRHSPLADLVILSAGVAVVFALLAAAVVAFGGMLARHAPVAWENALAEAAFATTDDAPDGHPEVRGALQDLADRLSARMDLPEGMTVTVHYLDEGAVNAFASLGGHVFVFRGLIARMPSENALAMVMAHEIAHVAHRDAAAMLGGGVLLQVILGAVLGSAPETLQSVLFAPNAVLLRGFSREAERRADRKALAAVAETYGHAGGAARLFEVFLAESEAAGGGEPPELLSTHPLSRNRIVALDAHARAAGWARDGALTPLPPALAALRDEAGGAP